jgi:hypothetical protein
MHIVAYSSRFPNISAAMPNTRALAVIGAFFEVKFDFFILCHYIFP